MTDIEQIASKLTDAQRRALLWLPADGSWRDHRRLPKANDGVSETSLWHLLSKTIGNPKKQIATTWSLAVHDFNSGEKEHRQMWRNTRWKLTPLGVAVRAHLKEQTNG